MLKDCVLKTRKITFDGGEFDVRGVALPDIASLVVEHREAVDRIAVIVRTHNQLDVEDTATVIEILIDIIRQSPFLAAHLICSCAEEPDAFSIAYRLPLTVQVEALRAIGDLTFNDAIALKKLIADVRGLLTGLLPTPAVAEAA
jgi:hypothetical protein